MPRTREQHRQKGLLLGRQADLGRLQGGGGSQQARREGRPPGGWAGWRERHPCLGTPQSPRCRSRTTTRLGGCGGGGSGKLSGGGGAGSRVPSPSLADGSQAAGFQGGVRPGLLAPSPPQCPTHPALQDPAPNPTCLLWDFRRSNLVCRDLPRPGPQLLGLRVQLASPWDLGEGGLQSPPSQRWTEGRRTRGGRVELNGGQLRAEGRQQV